jgi:hypothetical protein
LLSRCVVVAALAAILVLAPVASGATVALNPDRSFGTDGATFTAGKGEKNDVALTVRGKSFTVVDDGASISAGKGCVSKSASKVVCSSKREIGYFKIRLGNRDDRGLVGRSRGYSAARVVIHGGDGDDRIAAPKLTNYGFFSGQGGDDVLTGTRDDDALAGGPGEDRLVGGPGHDTLKPDARGSVQENDKMDGGRGDDLVDYSGRTKPVRVDLTSTSPQGVAGEKDVVANVESAIGTSGDDVLIGNADDNNFQGGAGSDTMTGGEGGDRLWGEDKTDPDTLNAGKGADIVIAEAGGTANAGDGADTLEVTDAQADAGAGDDSIYAFGGDIACGSGRDSVSIVKKGSPPGLSADCDEARLGRDNDLSIALPLQRQSDGLLTTLDCADQEVDGPTRDVGLCTNEMTVALGDTVVAGATYRLGENAEAVKLPYREGGQAALGESPQRVRLSVEGWAFDTVL